MNEINEPKYEEHFTAFVDLLGSSEISTGTNEVSRNEVLRFLVSLAALRGEFALQSGPEQTGTRHYIRPEVSTFSDHIVISYPLNQISENAKFNESLTAISVLHSFNVLLARIAGAALSIGFLIRGGATIGKLYHAGGVIFGEALVEAYRIESRTSIYPRVVLSSNVCRREEWLRLNDLAIRKGNDGLYYFDYFWNLVFFSVPPGEKSNDYIKKRFERIVRLTTDNLKDLEENEKLTEYSKWAWFAHEFRSAMERLPSGMLEAMGVSMDAIPWKN